MGAAAEVQADAVPLVLLHVAVPVLGAQALALAARALEVQVLGVRALALAARALEVQVLDALAPEVLQVAAQKVPVQGLRVAVPVLGVQALAPQTPAPAPAPAPSVPIRAVTLEIPARVDIRGLTLAALVRRGTLVTPVLRATRGLIPAAPAHAAIPILTQATQDLRGTQTTTPTIPTRRVIQTRAQAIPTRKVIQTRAQVALITTTATATITITTITMTTTTTTTITTAMTTARD